MLNAADSYRNARLIRTDDPEYIAYMRRMADQRPSRGGPRSAGEYLGGLVEEAIRGWLGAFVPLQEERILTWEQRLRNGRHGALFREIDGVWQIDDESLCLYEIKLTYAENMENGIGLRQLDASAQTLFADKRWKYILKRLVYVAQEPVTVLDGLPALEPNDEYAEEGVIWVAPEIVERSAQERGIELPENWAEPEAREGHVEDPAREEWRQYAGTEGEADEENPLADALRRALKDEETKK